MARIISIGATQHVDLLKARLGRGFTNLKGNGLMLELKESPAGKFTFLAFRVADCDVRKCTGGDQDVFKHCIAEIISDVILNHWEANLLKDIIKESYYYFDEEEKKQIYKLALHYFNREPENSKKAFLRLGRKSIIMQKLLEFLSQNNHIIIDGFIRFRLKEYTGELREAADKAVDDFLIEREYQEFIELLKYFVEIQESKVDTVHVIMGKKGTFKLFDENMQPVRSDYLGDFAANLTENEINYEDLLVSALITIAPNTIVLHCKNIVAPCTALDTIRCVFSGRVYECAGCNCCT